MTIVNNIVTQADAFQLAQSIQHYADPDNHRGAIRAMRAWYKSLTDAQGNVYFRFDFDSLFGDSLAQYTEVRELPQFQRDMDFQEAMIAWGVFALDDFRRMIARHFPHMEQYLAQLEMQFELQTDWTDREYCTPIYKFQIPQDWEQHNRFERADLVKFITEVVFIFRVGMKEQISAWYTEENVQKIRPILAAWRNKQDFLKVYHDIAKELQQSDEDL